MDIEKLISDNKIRIYVNPKSNKTEIIGIKDNRIKVNVKEPADKNKANIEVIKFFSRLLKKKVRIKNGLKSKEKTLSVED